MCHLFRLLPIKYTNAFAQSERAVNGACRSRRIFDLTPSDRARWKPALPAAEYRHHTSQLNSVFCIGQRDEEWGKLAVPFIF